MVDWNYTKKVAKIGLIYGLIGGIYFAFLLIFIFITHAYSWDTGFYDWGMFLSLAGYLFFFPLITPSAFIMFFWPLSDPDWILFVIPITGVFFGAILGFFIDLYRKNQKGDEKEDKINDSIFISIPCGEEKTIVITEKIVNCCIFIGIIIWAMLFIMNISGFTEEIGVVGTFEKGCRWEYTIIFDKDGGTFSEQSPDNTKTGTYNVNETILTLYYSDGKTAEYIVSDTGNELFPANRSQFASDEEWRNNNYLKPIPM